MHLQPDVKRELRHIGIGCAVGAVVLSAGWGLLAAAGTGLSFGPAVPVSAVLGAVFGAASVIWSLEHWSIARQTAVYFTVTAAVMDPLFQLGGGGHPASVPPADHFCDVRLRAQDHKRQGR